MAGIDSNRPTTNQIFLSEKKTYRTFFPQIIWILIRWLNPIQFHLTIGLHKNGLTLCLFQSFNIFALQIADNHSWNFDFLSSLPFGKNNNVHHTEAIRQKYAIYRYISFNTIFCRLLFPVCHSVSVTQCKESYAIEVCVSMHSVYFTSKFNRWSYRVLHLAHEHPSLVSEFTMSCINNIEFR